MRPACPDAGGSARMPPLRTSTGTSPRSSGASERNPMKLLRDYQGLAIRLTDERLAHILEHPEMAGLEQAIEETLLQPERVIESFSDPTAKLHYRYYADSRRRQVPVRRREELSTPMRLS